MRALVILLFTVTLLSGCFNNSFENHMRKGKDDLLANNYDEAIKSFDTALIEEPNNKDAIALMKRAKEEKADEDNKRKIEEFIRETDTLYKRLILIGNNTDIKNISYQEAKSKLDKLDPINKEFEDLSIKWNDEQLVTEAFQSLQSAIANLESSLSTSIDLIDDPEEIVDTDNNGEVSDFEFMRSRKGLMIRSFVSYVDDTKSYAKEVNELKEEK
ncbi:hypothetical protein [Paenibacillus polymyxa]|uniref:hypothetical protein n=1 Tax=Paenibacillus polymyxa TaxID=1406 RepID=UPI0008C80A15|nr:hypothetical protein [Paenibacillus polymyxa]SEI74674.1 hypothetical protein SAMN04488600_101569 [Paenibacillus polymyxa]